MTHVSTPTMQRAGRSDCTLMTTIHGALRRDLDQLLHTTVSHPSARARWRACPLPGGLAAALRPQPPADVKNTGPATR